MPNSESLQVQGFSSEQAGAARSMVVAEGSGLRLSAPREL